MFIFYDILFTLFAIAYFPYFLLKGKWHGDFRTRFGCFSDSVRKAITESGKKNIWIHAVSVGEVLAVVPLIKKLRKRCPDDYRIICSTVTETGQKIAQEIFGNDCIVIYAPLDWSWVVRKYIVLIQPQVYIAAETEIWPNLYLALHQKGIAIIQVNGRVSDKAFGGYKKFSYLMKRILGAVNVFCMQTELDAQRIKALGADPQKVQVLGNLKFDSNPLEKSVSREEIGLRDGDWLLLAGSTHDGEEDILIDAYQKLQKEFPHLRLAITPRHLTRCQEISKLIQEKGLQIVLFSQKAQISLDSMKILLVDEMGYLRPLYRLAQLVFVGKSLTARGGQNVIEPALLGRPIVVGPYTENFRDVVNTFLKDKAICQIGRAEELAPALRSLLSHPQKMEQMGRAAQQVVEKSQGATEKTLQIIEGFLPVSVR